ncbi:(d)CMP kinase [Actinoalloteichus sp. AHMU CJ021]|uniref:Cytidylate kinase n=1 Tax=Actinoalloteichus caeruleus DSM 43889 TaxID=1120930 RepID=A0ABT1JPV9_ACTCY|nr:(d)CMP kinase [Actinoalloteichus caeruleus]AUS80302.1 (d)CMP kinase [Actinoalloteichus sp. AHMU CJ021]MCP2334551.1 cytidylate kinase [Actinoalloteichus caeruleus DSM 43889]
MDSGQLRGVVALDGPSGTGKSTVARQLAVGYTARYLDTGAMYRAATLAVLRAEAPLDDPAAVTEVVTAADLRVGTDPSHPTVALDGEDVSAEIRGPEVTGAVSAVSAVPTVRTRLVGHQRSLIREALSTVGGVVVEGRDIGTEVVPDAGLKVFLTASVEVRARRRSVQDSAAGRRATLTATQADVERRDTLDSTRAVAPLRAAPDAVEVDTSDLDVSGVLSRLRELVEQRELLADTATGGTR